MIEDYVPSGIAKLLKEKGFNEPCRFVLTHAPAYQGKLISFDEQWELKDAGKSGEIIDKEVVYEIFNTNDTNDNNEKDFYSVPSLWRVMKWLRETHKIFIEVSVCIDLNGKYHYLTVVYDKEMKRRNKPEKKGYDTYEEAIEDTIKFCLEELL